jgi:TrmH family RNA methyltransferase
MKRITSRQNAVVARYRRVASGAADDVVLLDGSHLLKEAIASGTSVRHVMVGASALENAEVARLVAALERRGVEIASATAPVMAAASPLRSPSPIVALAERPRSMRTGLYAEGAPVVIACGVQDPGNIGAIVRVAEAAGAAALVATEGCADPYGWKALRGSMGSALRLPIRVNAPWPDAVAEARRAGARVLVTVPAGGRPMFDARLVGPLAVVVGGEGSGLPGALVDEADERITIPMAAPVESLNTAIAAALVLYEAQRQRGAAATSSGA